MLETKNTVTEINNALDGAHQYTGHGQGTSQCA